MAIVDTEIEVSASWDRMWELLTDFAAYPSWNPSITRLQGPLRPGAVLQLGTKLPGGLKLSLRPTLGWVDRGRGLGWSARLLASWFFAAEHYYVMEELAAGRIRLSQREEFHGCFAPFFLLFFGRGLRRSYAEANRRLKTLAERVAAREAHDPVARS